MSQKTKSIIRVVYSIVLSVMLACVALLFIFSCVNIYNSGDSPFTRASVAAAFSKISWMVLVTVLAAVGGFFLDAFLPADKRKKPERDVFRTLRILLKRFSLDKADSEDAKLIKAERKFRKILFLINSVFYIAGIIVSLVFVLDPAMYSIEKPNESIALISLVIAASLLPAVILTVVFSFLFVRSAQTEVEMIKKAVGYGALVSDSEADSVPSAPACRCLSAVGSFFIKNEKKIKLVLTSFVLIVAVLFVVLGVANGGFDDVIQKAVKICTECIGMG